MIKFSKFKTNLGLGLIDVIVGTSLMLIVFLGIFGAYQLGMKAIAQARNKIVATALANQELELIRNLQYDDVGTGEIGCHPCGSLEETTVFTRNNTEFIVERRVDFETDSADGESAPEDACLNDYKKVEIKVFWVGRFSGETILHTDVMPKNLAEECAEEGGILSISAFDAFGLMISSPLIEVKDPDTDQVLTFATPATGEHDFALATGTYKVVVSKSGHSTSHTYSTAEIANPTNACHARPHQEVFDGQMTSSSFCIDQVSSFSIDTFSSWGAGSFSDSFSNETKISAKTNIEVFSGKADLATDTEGYLDSGNLVSIDIVPVGITSWDEFAFSDSEPLTTDIKYQIFYNSGVDWVLIPDIDLPNNSTGFDSSSIDISSLDIGIYTELRLKASLSSATTTLTPTLNDWQVSWRIAGSNIIAFVDFNLRGEKTIGTDALEKPVYKYSENHTSDGSGHIDISNLEWDSYAITIDPATNLDLVAIDPFPQPVSLGPNANVSVYLYLEAENSLLVTIENSETTDPVFGASVRLYNGGLGYDVTQYTNDSGQTYFIPLEIATYNLEVEAPGYAATTSTANVSGDNIKAMSLDQIE